MAKNTSVMAMLAALNLGFSKNLSCSIGCSVCASHQRKADNTTNGHDEGANHYRIGPASIRRFDDGEDQGDQPDDREHRAQRIQRCRLRVFGFRNQEGTGDDGNDDDEDIDQEDRAPPVVLEQPPADHRAQDDPESSHARPHRDRTATLSALEHIGHDGEGRRHYQRTPDAHHGPRPDQGIGRVGEGRRHRAQPEDDQTNGQRQLAAEAITQSAHGEQQAGEHQDVGVDHPLQLARGRPELSDQSGEGDIEDGVVETDHHQAQGENDQSRPASAMNCFSVHSRLLGYLRNCTVSYRKIGCHSPTKGERLVGRIGLCGVRCRRRREGTGLLLGHVRLEVRARAVGPGIM